MLDEQKRETLARKIADAKTLILEALERFDTDKMAITWTGQRQHHGLMAVAPGLRRGRH